MWKHSATEFRLTVNETEETQAAGINLRAYMDSPSVVKAFLSSILESALLPLLENDAVDNF